MPKAPRYRSRNRRSRKYVSFAKSKRRRGIKSSGRKLKSYVRKSRFRGGGAANRRGSVDPRSGSKLVRLIKRISSNQLETRKFYGAKVYQDNYAWGGWGINAQSAFGAPTPVILEIDGEYPASRFVGFEGHQITMVGIKVNLVVGNRLENEVDTTHQKFRHFWVRQTIPDDDGFTVDDLNALVNQPAVKMFTGGTPAEWSKSASVANNTMFSHFNYAQENNIVKYYDTGWFNMKIYRTINQKEQPTASIYSQEPQHQYATINLSRWIPLNSVYRVARGTDGAGDPIVTLEGWVNQYLCFIFTGGEATAPLIEMQVDIYYKDA